MRNCNICGIKEKAPRRYHCEECGLRDARSAILNALCPGAPGTEVQNSLRSHSHRTGRIPRNTVAERLLRNAYSADHQRRNKGRHEELMTLTPDQIAAKLEAQDNLCFWTGIPLNLHPETERDLFAPSLDRVDNDKGYHDDNVVICCWAANAARGIADAERFCEWLRAVVRHAA